MTALQDAQARVEESIADVKEMIRDRVGVHGPWEIEWVEEVQKLLEMDAGWGWKGFWQTVLANLRVSPSFLALSTVRSWPCVRETDDSVLRRMKRTLRLWKCGIDGPGRWLLDIGSCRIGDCYRKSGRSWKRSSSWLTDALRIDARTVLGSQQDGNPGGEEGSRSACLLHTKRAATSCHDWHERDKQPA